jgi:hypothetical protein
MKSTDTTSLDDQAYWQKSGYAINPDKYYVVHGSHLNHLHDLAVERFNELPVAENTAHARGFWNGYGAATAALRNLVRFMPYDAADLDRKVQ